VTLFQTARRGGERAAQFDAHGPNERAVAGRALGVLQTRNDLALVKCGDSDIGAKPEAHGALADAGVEGIEAVTRQSPINSDGSKSWTTTQSVNAGSRDIQANGTKIRNVSR